MKKRYRYPLVALTTFAIGIGVMTHLYGWCGVKQRFEALSWGDIKLRLVLLSGYFTLHNNPLLPSLDSDRQALLDNPRVSLDQLLSGGPPKDGIPAIDEPRFVSAAQTTFSPDEPVVGVFLGGQAKAYPYSILNWHEIVNDTIGQIPVSVTFCPLCNTNPVFIRRLDGEETTFGVSGKLYQSCLVMYDRASNTLWSQPWGMGIAGRWVNRRLQRVPAVATTLGRWEKLHPNTLVLSTETGFRRDYHRDPYGDYRTEPYLLFPVRNQEQLKIRAKDIVTYVWRANDKTPFNTFSGEAFQVSVKTMQQQTKLNFHFAGKPAAAVWDERLARVAFYSEGREIPASTAYAFVYPAFFSLADPAE